MPAFACTGHHFVYRARTETCWRFWMYFLRLNINVNLSGNFDKVCNIFHKYEVNIMTMQAQSSFCSIKICNQMLLRSCILSSGDKNIMRIAAFGGCVGKRAYERDCITKLFRARIPLRTSRKNIILSQVIHKVLYFNDLQCDNSRETIFIADSNDVCINTCTYVESRGKRGVKTQTCSVINK